MVESPARQKPKKLLDQVRDAMRLKHYAYRTEEPYVQVIDTHVLNRGGRGVRSPLDSG